MLTHRPTICLQNESGLFIRIAAINYIILINFTFIYWDSLFNKGLV
ncbi:Uncharacterized protein YR821_1645 [Yersinia ruckeri]|uniref:Uncharacterized protein n=1 Tax=Yersinia ruckeri TaxID=29486 RepID=A0A0A8VGG5_YERRU|nr:hypothetical protein yruck0001_14950 [Yersinia ruckeri ATCC 29473]QTD76569.1 Uncharacterized protein YR821_1645 [Yersinia ruckeri]CEK27468.1 hypothetical protein CSF007_8575 [Yersinia ruckeri]